MNDVIKKMIQKLDTLTTRNGKEEDVNYIFGYIKATIDDIEILKKEDIENG